MGYNLASFKNSRNYPRPATTTATTSDAIIVGSAGPLGIVPLLAANPNITYVTLYNRSPTDAFKYYYQHAGDPIPTIAQILANGFEIIAGAAIDLESPEAVWAVSETVNPIPVDIDEGNG